MATEKTTVLITGANRGIGRGLAEAYLARPDHVVIAAVRDPAAATSVSLQEVKRAAGTTLQIVKIDSRAAVDPTNAVEAIKAAGVTRLDIVIANAGIVSTYGPLHLAKIEDFRDMVEVNGIAPWALYQAVYPLLKAGEGRTGAAAPKFLGVSSQVATIEQMENFVRFQTGVYSTSKAMLNFVTRWAALENRWLNAFVVHPGFVQSDMGNTAAKLAGLEKAPVTIQESVEGVTKLLDNATIETTSGKFFNYDGTPKVF